jgi:hypothetical protein
MHVNFFVTVTTFYEKQIIHLIIVPPVVGEQCTKLCKNGKKNSKLNIFVICFMFELLRISSKTI